MRRIWAILLGICLILTGCGMKSGAGKYSKDYFGAFDTYTTISGFAQSQKDWDGVADTLYAQLWEYHQLFDIYHTYEGMNNVKTINDQAGVAPVQVDQRILALLLDCKAYYVQTGGRVNVAMGSVLRLWHAARTEGTALPDAQALEEAAKHADWENVIIDVEKGTVFLKDPQMSLDVGAVAKGWATQKVAESASEGVLLSVGGNICATGPKTDGSAWKVGVQDPDNGAQYLQVCQLEKGTLVTSGDYQRYYIVDGKRYHHIIDPATGYPSEYWRSVTIRCDDAALADVLSTALFLLPKAEGEQLLEQYGAEAMWVDAQGQIFTTAGFVG